VQGICVALGLLADRPPVDNWKPARSRREPAIDHRRPAARYGEWPIQQNIAGHSMAAMASVAAGAMRSREPAGAAIEETDR
jgi:hypothetical protein